LPRIGTRATDEARRRDGLLRASYEQVPSGQLPEALPQLPEVPNLPGPSFEERVNGLASQVAGNPRRRTVVAAGVGQQESTLTPTDRPESTLSPAPAGAAPGNQIINQIYNGPAPSKHGAAVGALGGLPHPRLFGRLHRPPAKSRIVQEVVEQPAGVPPGTVTTPTTPLGDAAARAAAATAAAAGAGGGQGRTSPPVGTVVDTPTPGPIAGANP
jgi:hypothetical protein